jgi:hypothetical protein
VQQGCPPRVLPFVARLAQVEQVPEDLRLLAVQALGSTREPGSARGLIGLVDGGRTLFRRQKLAAKSPSSWPRCARWPERWRKHPKVEPLLGLAAVANDDELREAVR